MKIKTVFGFFLALLLSSCTFDLPTFDSTSSSTSSNQSSSQSSSQISTDSEITSDSSTSNNKPKYATIFSINDLHGSLDVDTSDETSIEPGIARLKKAIESDPDYDKDSSIIVSAGDSWQGGYLSFKNKNLTDELLGDMGVKAMTIGNHEFDWGVSTIEALSETSPFPFLACNILDYNNKQVTWAKPSYSYTTPSGVKYGLIGAIGPGEESDILSSNIDGYTFTSATSYIDNEITKLKEANCDLIFLVVHDGVTDSNGYINNLGNKYNLDSGINGIIGAHTHQSEKQKVGTLPYVQAGSNSKYYGKIKTSLSTKSVVSYGSYSATSYASLPDSDLDQTIIAKINEANTSYQSLVEMNSEFDSTFRRYYELNKWIPSAMLYEAKKQGWGLSYSKNELIAVHNLAGIRSNISKGKAIRKTLFKASPFNNALKVIKNISGSTIRNWMGEDDSDKTNTTTYNCYDTESSSFDENKTYDLLTIDFLSTSNYFHIKGTQFALNTTANTDVYMPDAVLDYVEESGISVFNASDYDVRK
jgi:2',3'-cyclic-nucleotide 2'-phosphodiesterase/3'-nucleotidase